MFCHNKTNKNTFYTIKKEHKKTRIRYMFILLVLQPNRFSFIIIIFFCLEPHFNWTNQQILDPIKSKPKPIICCNIGLKRKSPNTSVNWLIFVEALTILPTKRYNATKLTAKCKLLLNACAILLLFLSKILSLILIHNSFLIAELFLLTHILNVHTLHAHKVHNYHTAKCNAQISL